jgi:hypothetical protein
MTVAALVPAFNEADTIAATVEAIQTIPALTRLVVIDDASTDKTAALAQQAGALVLRRSKNGGKGAALQQGVAELERLARETQAQAETGGGSGAQAETERLGLAREAQAGSGGGSGAQTPHPDIVLLLDGDLGASAREARALLDPLIDDLADMTIGVLPTPPGSGGFGVVKNLARGAIREWGGGYSAQAPLSGQRALTWECLQAVLPFADGYGVEVALTVRALQQDYRVFELRVEMQHRATGRTISGFLHRARQYLDVRRTITHLKSP